MLKNFDDFLNENELNEKSHDVDFSKMDWMSVGKEYTEDMPKIQKLIRSMQWKPIIPGERIAFSPGAAIKNFIKEFKVAAPTMYALPSGTFDLEKERGAAYTVLGVQGTYANGTYRFYFVDSGDSLTPIGALKVLPGRKEIIADLGEKPTYQDIAEMYGVDDDLAAVIAGMLEKYANKQ